MLQPPNGPRLISFLKAMEFSTLTRRVAEATGADVSQIEPAQVAVQRGADAHGPDMGAGITAAVADGAAQQAPASDRPEGERRKRPHKRLRCLAAARAEAAMAEKFDVHAYVCIRDVPTLTDWIAEATEAGVVALSAQTTSMDPMQAELTGLSLATRPGRAAYVPLPHKTGQGDLLGGGLAPKPDRRPRCADAAQAAIAGQVCPQDGAEPEIRSCRDEPVRHRDRTV